MNENEAFVSAIVEMLEAYRKVTSGMIKRLESIERRVECLDGVQKNMKKFYDSRFEELHSLRNDVDIISRQLLEMRKLSKELTQVIDNIES